MCVTVATKQEIDSIEVSKDTEAVDDDGIDGIPIPAETVAATAVTAADNGKKVSASATKTSSQPANDAESDEEDEWKGVAPQGTAGLC